VKNVRLFAVALLVCAIGLVSVHASSAVGIFARVDKVVFEPNPDSPDRIQVWGVFSIADPANHTFQPAARGYLYFKVDSNVETTRNEWNDLKQVAGTGQIVAFGNFSGPRRLRKPDEKPDSPDPYTLDFGVQKVSGSTNNPPVRAILEFKD
jgi:hypothetical protein